MCAFREVEKKGLAALVEYLISRHPPKHLPESARKVPKFNANGEKKEQQKAAQKMVSYKQLGIFPFGYSKCLAMHAVSLNSNGN